jgi:hypothetical protein
MTLSGSGGNFTSTAIITTDDGLSGTCRFDKPVPPGDYTLDLSRFQLRQGITIAKEPKDRMTATLTFTKRGLVIDIR